ncbi:hypothetical protein CK203_116868 [Vitis vinifera]|uniref:Uncharacterized protein n=1 Tax=Vitis vinifera TaxID=29760 RepID=A0A438CXC4_VITVI|nr:hypothetical protein CK203_116868 [Vitis vinifera]
MSVSSNGDADINLVQSGINPDTRLVSVMAALGKIPGDVQKTRLSKFKEA